MNANGSTINNNKINALMEYIGTNKTPTIEIIKLLIENGSKLD